MVQTQLTTPSFHNSPHNDRDDNGRFAQGNNGGPGRPKHHIEVEYMASVLAEFLRIRHPRFPHFLSIQRSYYSFGERRKT